MQILWVLLHFVTLNTVIVPSVSAWGVVGHELIANLASIYLSPHATTQVQSILRGQSLASIASWADRIKWLEQYKFTSELHYINIINDNPPDLCRFDWEAPGHQEIIAAIYNYTQILRTADNGTWKQSEALRFLVHYIQDLHQPLHRKAKGGNDIPLIFDGVRSNLHSLWDSLGLAKRIHSIGSSYVAMDRATNSFAKDMSEEMRLGILKSPDALTSYEQYINILIQSPYYRKRMQEWLRCPHNSVNSRFGCADVWAQDIAPINCQYIWNGLDLNGTLSADYWAAIEENLVFEELIMKATIRLAAVLNAVFADRAPYS